MILGQSVLLTLLALQSSCIKEDEMEDWEDDEEGVVKEDLSQYTREGAILYKTLWKPRHCDGPTKDGDDVDMNMEYSGRNKDGEEVEMNHALTTKIGRGQVMRIPVGLLGMCLGEKRRLLIPENILRNKYKQILPDILDLVNTFLDVEVTAINRMTWHRYKSGLLLAMLEPVDPEYCFRSVEEGDTLYVDYEGSLEDGTIFDTSERLGYPFGPFVHGRGQIIDGYTEVLTDRCLGERWRMIVPPHLAYGEEGVENTIPGDATLTFDVRLVQLNEIKWTDEVRNKKIFGWEVIYKPEVCEEIAGYEDELFIHYEAHRDDGSQFGSMLSGSPPYGPFSLGDEGTFVPALDLALPGMCLGERRMVNVTPRLGWAGSSRHHDTIKVELFLVKVNGADADVLPPQGPPRRGEL